jgi:hypothetical protein
MGTHGSALPFFKQKPITKKIRQIQTEWRQYATIVLENVRRDSAWLNLNINELF